MAPPPQLRPPLPPPRYAPLPLPRPVMPPPQPTWGYQPQPGFAPYPVLPPRRKSSSGPILALVLGGVVILGLGAVGVFAAAFNNKVKDTGYSNYTTYSPTGTYTTTTTTTTTTTSTRTSSPRTSSTQPTPVGPKAVYKLADHPIWPTLRAVREGRVAPADANGLFSRPGPRLIDGIEHLASLLRP